MTVIQNTARRIGLAWTPMYTTIAIVAAALLIGLLPGVKMNLVVNGIFLGAIIALGAIGLTLVYGILNFANIAHGDYMTMGAYVALFIVGSLLPQVGIEGKGLGPFTFGYPMLIALPIAVAAVAALAVVLDIAIYRRLRERGVNNVVLAMASLGLAIALRGLVQIIWSGDVQRYPRETRKFYQLAMDVRVPPDAIFITIVTVTLVVAVYLVLTRTKIGKAMRATADNPNLALVSGIDTQRVIWSTWIIGAAGGDRRDTPGGVSGAVATRYGVEIPDSAVRSRHPGGHRQPLRSAGWGIYHRSVLGGLDPVDQPQLQARGGLRHYDGGAAGEAQGHIRRRQVSIAIDWKRPGSLPEGRESWILRA